MDENSIELTSGQWRMFRCSRCRCVYEAEDWRDEWGRPCVYCGCEQVEGVTPTMKVCPPQPPYDDPAAWRI